METLQKRSSYCHRPAELRGDDKNPVIFGYAAVFYNGAPETQYEIWDDYVERIHPGCFDRPIREKHDVRCLFNHDSSSLLGRTISETLRLAVDAVGLFYECQSNPADPDHTRVHEKLRRKDVSGSSFQFVPTAWTIREEGGVTICEITDCDLYDVGPVTYPAYEGSTSGLRALRSDDARQRRDELHKIIEQKSKCLGELSERRKTLLDQKKDLAAL